MGAWSHEPFGNDTALDWAAELATVKNLAVIEAAFDAVNEDGEDYLDASAGEEAVAAAQALAGLMSPAILANACPESVQDWARQMAEQPNPALKRKARQALQRVLSESSELRELWGETDDFAAWQDSLRGLQAVIGT